MDEASRGWWRGLVAWLGSLVGILLVLSGVLHFLIFSDVFHGLEHRHLGVRPSAQPSAAELTERLQAYFRAPGSALMEPEVFSYRERLHFREVKRLMRCNSLAFTASAVVMVLGSFVFGLRAGEARKMFARVLALTGRLLLLVVTAAALLRLNFDASFLRLHRLLFDSTNWVLPADSVTVEMFPLRYFSDFLVVYGLLIACAAVLCLLGAFVVHWWADGRASCLAAS